MPIYMTQREAVSAKWFYRVWHKKPYRDRGRQYEVRTHNIRNAL